MNVLVRIRVWTIAVVIAAFAVLYLLAVPAYWKLTPDSATYVLAAESLATGGRYHEWNGRVYLYPPGTSLLFAVGWMIGGGRYWVLNAEVALAAIGAVLFCFLLFRRTLRFGSAVVVLLSIGSALLFEWSTFLLSDIFFLMASMIALWLWQRGSTAGTAIALLASCAIRLIGITLAAAILVDSVLRRKWRDALATLPAILFTAGWELRNRRAGISHIGLMLENDPWVPSHGRVSMAAMLERIIANLGSFRDLGAILTNTRTGWAVVTIPILVLLAMGMVRMWTTERVLVIYAVIFMAAVLCYHPWIETRWLLPLIPVLFCFLFCGVDWTATSLGRTWTWSIAGVLIGLYLVAGLHRDLTLVRAARNPQFASEGVTLVDHEDLQRLALWWKANSTQSEVYACQHPSLLRVITSRAGVVYPFPAGLDGFEAELAQRGVRYLFLDMDSDWDAHAVLPLVGRSRRWTLVKADGRALLYQFKY